MRTDLPGARAMGSSTAFWTPLAVVSLTVLVFCGAILWMTSLLRQQLFSGILRMDGEILRAAAIAGAASKTDETPQEQLLRMLDVSDFKEQECFAIRLFNQDGKYLKIGRAHV